METENRSTAGAAAAGLSEEGGSTISWLTVDDESASELSKLLELFDAPPPPKKVRFVDDPYSSLVLFQASSYITINANEESCGSSFSVSDSSVMAGVDAGGARRRETVDSAEVRAWWNEGIVGVAEEIWGSYFVGKSVD